MKIAMLYVLLLSSLQALQTSEKLFECTEIFKERKSELLVELERIDEQKQALSALRIATEELLRKKESSISQKEEAVNLKLEEIRKKEQSVKEMLVNNEKVLKELKELKMSKVAQTFAKMKAASAANILSTMEPEAAVEILKTLKPKSVGQILTKIEPQKASKITLMLAQ